MNIFEKQLFEQDGKVILPLVLNEEVDINPQPNFLVIKNIASLITADFPTLEGSKVPTVCMESYMSLEYREVLYDENQEPVGTNIVSYVQFLQPISLALINLLQSKESLVQNSTIINTFLPMITFKGFLTPFKCILDSTLLENYINEINNND